MKFQLLAAAALLYCSASAAAEPLRVACVGDSVTAGPVGKAATTSYPAQLQALLGDRYEVRNFGVGGATLIRQGEPNVWQKLPAVLESRPDIVVVALGLNDTVSGNRRHWERIASFDADAQNLIDQLAQLPTHPRILLCTPTSMVLDTPNLPPQRLADLKQRAPRLEQLCAALRKIAAANAGKRVELVELNSVLKNHPEWLTPGDGVHPNAAGYQAIAQAAASAVAAPAPNPRAAARPNLIFMLIDDMGWQETSVPFHTEITPLNRRYRTPHLERLAAEGMKFTQAYASALCSPSRVSALTGMNAARHRVTNWTLRKNVSPDQPHAKFRAPDWNVNGVSPVAGVEKTCHATPLPELLRAAGYRTIHVGKAHFGAVGTPGENPLNLGFDVNIAGHAAGGPGSYWGAKNFSAAWRTRPPDRVWDVPGLEAYHGQNINLTEVLTREAIQAMEQSVADRQPFYLYLSHYAVHAPYEKDDRYYQKYLDAGLQPFEATLASMIESMDQSLGDVRAALDRLGVADNTIVLFLSDNGAPQQCPRNLPLRGHKISPYEGGVRVPMIVRWPHTVAAGAVCSQPVVIEDIFPTLLEMAGAPAPQTLQTVDGISIVPLLKQTGQLPADRALVWHFPHRYLQTPYSAIRLGPWKLIYHHLDRRRELFNLDQDLSEAQDLSHSHPEQATILARRLAELLKERGALMPLDPRSSQPTPWPDAVN